MKLSEVFDPDLIVTSMRVATKEEAVSQLADLFCHKYPDKIKDDIIKSVNEREKLGNTSMGRGVAFPHARTDQVTGLYVICGITPQGLQSDTPDGKPLHIIILLLTPRNISRNYLQTLSGLAMFARKPETLPALVKAGSPDEVMKIIEKSDIKVKKILTVGDVMTPDPVTVTRDKTLKDVANLFFEKKIRCMPVVDDDGELVGEITANELLKFALPNYKSFIANIANIPQIESFEELLRNEHQARVSNFMKANAVTVEMDAPVIEAAALMLFKKAEMVSVLDGGKLVGVITKSDIISKIIRG